MQGAACFGGDFQKGICGENDERRGQGKPVAVKKRSHEDLGKESAGRMALMPTRVVCAPAPKAGIRDENDPDQTPWHNYIFYNDHRVPTAPARVKHRPNGAADYGKNRKEAAPMHHSCLRCSGPGA
jgi:hypothetical protein